MNMISKARNLLTKCLAHYVLEKKATRCSLSPKAIAEMRVIREQLVEAYEQAYELCAGAGVCQVCEGSCCMGSHSRFTVLDYYSNLIADCENGEWGYISYPFGSYNRNRIDAGWCKYFKQNAGCSLPYCDRPSTCICYTCSRLDEAIRQDDKKRLEEIKTIIDKLHLRMTCRLIFGRSMWVGHVCR